MLIKFKRKKKLNYTQQLYQSLPKPRDTNKEKTFVDNKDKLYTYITRYHLNRIWLIIKFSKNNFFINIYSPELKANIINFSTGRSIFPQVKKMGRKNRLNKDYILDTFNYFFYLATNSLATLTTIKFMGRFKFLRFFYIMSENFVNKEKVLIKTFPGLPHNGTKIKKKKK